MCLSWSHPFWGWLSSNVKKQEMETHKLFIKGDEAQSTCLVHLSLSWVYKSAWKKEGQAVFHVAHKPWPLITLLRLLVLPGPSGIGDLLIVLVLNLCPLGIKPTGPLGWIYHGSFQPPPQKKQWYQLLLLLAEDKGHHLFSPPPSAFPVPSVTCSFKSITYNVLRTLAPEKEWRWTVCEKWKREKLKWMFELA